VRSHPRAAAFAALGVTLLSALSCARPGNPRGGVPDRRPPVVIATTPAPKASVTDPGTEIRFQFNERISERVQRGTLDDAVLLSPATGAVHVHHGGDYLSVRVDGGLKPNLTYRVTLLPVISDLFNNTMRDPFEIVFSTGGKFIENAFAGQIVDRITGRPVSDLTVQLLPRAPQPDTLLYVARTNDQGLYFLRFLAPGNYNIVAFQDVNRNGKLDPKREPAGQRGLLVGERPDSVLTLNLTVLEPDSTAARLTRADVVDSTTLRLTFTDYLDPEFIPEARVSLTAPEGHVAPGVRAILHPEDYDAQKDTARGRQLRAARPQGVPAAVPGMEQGGLPPGMPLPKQDLVVQLDKPLELGVEYRVSATGVVNINRIPLGRGDTTVVRKAPPPPRSRADSIRAGLTGPAGGAAGSGAAPGARPDTTVRPTQTAPQNTAQPDTTIRRDSVDVVAVRQRRKPTRT
jgi:hypothetical protein